MKRGKLLTLLAGICLILVLTALFLPACAGEEDSETTTPASESTTTPAEFEVISLDIEPTEITAGETVTVTAVVENSGGSEGAYTAILTVNGVTSETEEVVITPGSSEVVTFSLVEDTPGTYEIGVGDLSANLTVNEEFVITEFELGYDDGTYDSYTAIGRSDGTGYLVDFLPLATPFTIDGVKIFGYLYGTGYESLEFAVEIWDDEQEIVYSASYPHTEFGLEPGWLEIDIPNVVVDGTFYIHVFTHSPPDGGIYVCYDSSVANEHSDMTQDYEVGWWGGAKPQETVNWMIRVVGTAAVTVD